MESANDRLNLTMNSAFDDALIASSCDDAIVTEISIGSLKACAFLSVFVWTFSPESFAVKVIERASSIRNAFDFYVNVSTIESKSSIASLIVYTSLIGIEKTSCCALIPLVKNSRASNLHVDVF
jgi:hypothetical protein